MNTLYNEPIHIDEGQTFHLQVGRLRLHCTRLASEWQISQAWEEEDISCAEYQIDYVVPNAKPGFRFVLGKTDSSFRITPRLARMNVVVRPMSPILIPKGAEVTFYISTTPWFQLELSQGKSQCIHEVPAQQDSETWFGQNSYEGELGFSSQTHARMHFNAVARHQGRIITALHLRNKSENIIQVDRLNVPVPFLSSYISEEGYICTNDVLVELQSEKEGVDVNIQRLPNELFGQVKKVSEPRVSFIKGVFRKAMNTFFQ